MKHCVFGVVLALFAGSAAFGETEVEQLRRENQQLLSITKEQSTQIRELKTELERAKIQLRVGAANEEQAVKAGAVAPADGVWVLAVTSIGRPAIGGADGELVTARDAVRRQETEVQVARDRLQSLSITDRFDGYDRFGRTQYRSRGDANDTTVARRAVDQANTLLANARRRVTDLERQIAAGEHTRIVAGVTKDGQPFTMRTSSPGQSTMIDSMREGFTYRVSGSHRMSGQTVEINPQSISKFE